MVLTAVARALLSVGCSGGVTPVHRPVVGSLVGKSPPPMGFLLLVCSSRDRGIGRSDSPLELTSKVGWQGRLDPADLF